MADVAMTGHRSMASSLQHEASDERMDTNPDISNTDATSRGGLNAAAAKWTINYFVVGDESSSSTEVNPEMSVDLLKKQINTELELIPRKYITKLRLYHVDIPDDDNLVNKANEQVVNKKEGDVLRSSEKLSAVFLGPPVNGKVHILVQPPQTGEFLRVDLIVLSAHCHSHG
jgi:hypothetical protein